MEEKQTRHATKPDAQPFDEVRITCKLHHQPPFLGCERMADMLANAKNTTAQLPKDLTA